MLFFPTYRQEHWSMKMLSNLSKNTQACFYVIITRVMSSKCYPLLLSSSETDSIWTETLHLFFGSVVTGATWSAGVHSGEAAAVHGALSHRSNGRTWHPSSVIHWPLLPFHPLLLLSWSPATASAVSKPAVPRTQLEQVCSTSSCPRKTI